MRPRGTRSPPSNGRGNGPARKSGRPASHTDRARSQTKVMTVPACSWALPGAAADEHLLIGAPRLPAVLGALSGPPEVVVRDVAEAPALRRLVIEPLQHDVAAVRAADEATDTAVERIDPRGAPCRDRRVIEAQRRPMEG